ncbi:rRNA biogenesis protein RRP36 [Termitomyces sp. T112]|nr:rRNA biogenesis protein RRP36 [Termitomyces sp. T112]KAH0590777.1 hypothetical protein H2248_000902 [Termitomyces sp. 'cryptogamus']
MPRRPRPLSRQKRISTRPFDNNSPSLNIKSPKRSLLVVENEVEDEDTLLEASASNAPNDAVNADLEEDGEDDSDLDAPRIAQWIDEDELEQNYVKAGPSSNLKSLKNDLLGMPLGALRKAQNVLAQTAADTESDESEEESELQSVSEKGKERKKVEWSIRPSKEITKRVNKHAPTEVTSKRPVTRKRTVVEVKTMQARDPRFLPLAGQFSAEKFRQGYSFLAGSHISELDALREHLKRARKLLVSSPRDLYEERADEVQKLEQAVKRAESLVNKDRRDKIEQEALAKVKKEERDKRKQGKGEWHMKNVNKRELLMKAQYEALAAEGGKRAVRKAIEKKQKRIGQKERRSRPFVQDGAKRRRVI